jgi:TPR repeat protein
MILGAVWLLMGMVTMPKRSISGKPWRSRETRAQVNLGIMYDYGKGLPEDPIRAAKWYQAAALQGSCSAQFNLAVMYDTGRGVRKDPINPSSPNFCCQGEFWAEMSLFASITGWFFW